MSSNSNVWANTSLMRHPRAVVNNAKNRFVNVGHVARVTLSPRLRLPRGELPRGREPRRTIPRVTKVRRVLSLSLSLSFLMVRRRQTGASGCTLVENSPRLIWCPWTELARHMRARDKPLWIRGVNLWAPTRPYFRAVLCICVRDNDHRHDL